MNTEHFYYKQDLLAIGADSFLFTIILNTNATMMYNAGNNDLTRSRLDYRRKGLPDFPRYLTKITRDLTGCFITVYLNYFKSYFFNDNRYGHPIHF